MKVLVASILLLVAGTAGAEELICRGNIVSTQGEGIVARKHRFEVSDVTGDDVQAVLEKCRKIALERQGRAARKNPGGNFTPLSQVELQCSKGNEKIEVRRTIQTR
ncbi:hypothetical protein M1B72_20645 [Geomonas paludis]|uniref:Lipoprotein n=1 Tax=Geomonas paludis TaxID=2740185 RepID=A0A6V8MS74_9BACT|nr:hypothetical protein [Geomonas paludis]UPU35821.1 hypothetical protein M1B72_20645 [Geomonas paludis]GFO62597.1 hypothetical protein GMPD_05160 [Geomonas paludis]